MPITLSTIAHSQHAANLLIFRDWGVDRVCPDIHLNRRPTRLREYARQVASRGIEVELLANEFCFAGRSPCCGVPRDACYAHSALGGNLDGAFDGWPFGLCRRWCAAHPASLLRAPYILPHQLPWYTRKLGISRFKIAGHTKSIADRLRTIKRYLAMDLEGHLADLWMEPDSTVQHIPWVRRIAIRDLESTGVLERWMSEPARDCEYDCEVGCAWCDSHWHQLTELLATREQADE
jgi:collagenase-like PrtC family protease